MEEVKPTEPTLAHTRLVVVDGEIIYTGDQWKQPFLEASMNPDNGTIVHVEDGKPGAMFSAPLHKRPTEKS